MYVGINIERKKKRDVHTHPRILKRRSQVSGEPPSVTLIFNEVNFSKLDFKMLQILEQPSEEYISVSETKLVHLF